MASKAEYDRKYEELTAAILQRVASDPDFRQKLKDTEKARYDLLEAAGFKDQIDELMESNPQLAEAEVGGHCSYTCYTDPSGNAGCNPYQCT
jgi:hypothetical protein